MLREIGNTLDGVENENLSKEVCRREEGLSPEQQYAQSCQCYSCQMANG
jgi:hypothetical protein